MRVQSVKRALANPKTDADSWDVTSVINPAIDMLRAIHAQTELAQRCFGDLKFTDAEPGGSTRKSDGRGDGGGSAIGVTSSRNPYTHRLKRG